MQLTINTTSLPHGNLGIVYNQTLLCGGGLAPKDKLLQDLPGGVLSVAYVATPATPGAIGLYLQGKLKGSYYINNDGSVDVTAGKLTTGWCRW